MSFAVWPEKPPFEFAEEDREQLYQVGDVWVVTDDPKRATQEEVDVLRNAPAPKPDVTASDLQALLVSKGFISEQDVVAVIDAKASVRD